MLAIYDELFLCLPGGEVGRWEQAQRLLEHGIQVGQGVEVLQGRNPVPPKIVNLSQQLLLLAGVVWVSQQEAGEPYNSGSE